MDIVSAIPDVIRFAMTGLLTSLLISGAMWLIERAPPEEYDGVTGRIKMNRVLILLLAAVPLALTVTALHRYVTFIAHPYTLLIALGCFALGWCILVWIKADYDVVWTAHGLTGPTSYGVWPFGPTRAAIAYPDITDVGIDWAGSFYVANAQGQRIRWSWCYSGYAGPACAIEDARPDLFPDEDPEEWDYD